MTQHSVEKDAGCYICQPDNPNAAKEGCADCEHAWWAWYMARVTQPGGGA